VTLVAFGGGVVGLILLVTTYIVSRAAGTVIGRDVAGWLPHLSRSLVVQAARHLPEEHRLRYEEEWRRHVSEFDDRPLTALVTALGYAMSVPRLGHELAPAPKPARARTPFRGGGHIEGESKPARVTARLARLRRGSRPSAGGSTAWSSSVRPQQRLVEAVLILSAIVARLATAPLRLAHELMEGPDPSQFPRYVRRVAIAMVVILLTSIAFRIRII
jgi:hypothetical protein